MKKILLFSSIMLISSAFLKAQTIMNIHQNNGTILQLPLNTIDSITYTITNPGNLATLTTNSANNIVNTSATSGGNISSNGGTPVTQRGVVWSTNVNPTTADNTSIAGSGTGNFTSNLSGLIANTTYYVRAYAINSAGTAYGNEVSFVTTGVVITPGLGVAFDGYTYSSIVLGNGQEWMSENLRTTIYANGDTIPNVSDGALWSNLTTGAWAHYNNDSQYESTYGKLYIWYTVVDPRNVCPNGWHVPSDIEWTLLSDYFGGESVAGGKMKSVGTQYWQSPNTDATNESGFTGLPGGQNGFTNSTFYGLGVFGGWWSSTEANAGGAWDRLLYNSNGNLARDPGGKGIGFSVRCLKD
jgi:uncharacterized protein (TIGR02145 family)